MSTESVRMAMVASATAFAALGLLLLFAAEDVSGLLGPQHTNHPLLQLVGAALLGFAAMNWIARGSALGGILLLKHGLEVANTLPWLWALTVLYSLGAGYFTYLTFFRTGIERPS